MVAKRLIKNIESLIESLIEETSNKDFNLKDLIEMIILLKVNIYWI